MKVIPSIETLETFLLHERSLDADHVGPIAGVDEVGRGALAGPLVSAAVILPPFDQILADPFWLDVRDSKTIRETERIRLSEGIRERAVAVGVAAIAPELLDWIGVGPANRMAMEGAIFALPTPPSFVLLDAFVTDLGTPQVSLVKGDGRSLSIAAASIVAKVARDTVMHDYDREYDVYGFGAHKGYGVARHLAALQTHGPCPIHRFCFAPVASAREFHRDHS